LSIPFEWYNSSKTSFYFINNNTVANGTVDNYSYALYCSNFSVVEGNSSIFYWKQDFEDGLSTGWGYDTATMAVTNGCAMKGSYGLNCSSTTLNKGCYYNLSQFNIVNSTVYAAFNAKEFSEASPESSFFFGNSKIVQAKSAGTSCSYGANILGGWNSSTATTWANWHAAKTPSDGEYYNYRFIWYNLTNWRINAYNSSNSALLVDSYAIQYNSPTGLQYFEMEDGASSGSSNLRMCVDDIFLSVNQIDTYSAPSIITLSSMEVYYGAGATANETVGREAIIAGIDASEIAGNYSAYDDKQVYIRLANGSQYKGTFDKFIVFNNGSNYKRWAFNYDQNTSSGFPSFLNITPVFYVWQKYNMNYEQIKWDVSAVINSTYP
jgi:hypothetical protein